MPTRAPSHVIILGGGRSGTSIFGELFEHLALYTYYSEPPFEQLIQLGLAGPVAICLFKLAAAHSRLTVTQKSLPRKTIHLQTLIRQALAGSVFWAATPKPCRPPREIAIYPPALPAGAGIC